MFLTPASYVAEVALRSRANRPDSEVAGEVALRCARSPRFCARWLGWKVGEECARRGLTADARTADVDADIAEHRCVPEAWRQGLPPLVVSGFRARFGQREVEALGRARGNSRRRACPVPDQHHARARDEVSGWRFYPEAKIAEIVDVIERGEPRYDYQMVRGSLDRCVRKACLIEKA